MITSWYDVGDPAFALPHILPIREVALVPSIPSTGWQLQIDDPLGPLILLRVAICLIRILHVLLFGTEITIPFTIILAILILSFLSSVINSIQERVLRGFPLFNFDLLVCVQATQYLGYGVPFGLPLCLQSLSQGKLDPSVLLLDEIILEYGMYHALPEVLEVLGIEWYSLPLTTDEAIGRCLNRVHICDIEVSPHSNPCTILFILLNAKLTAEEAEHVRALTDQLGKRADLHVLGAMEWEVWAVHENGLASGVSMHVEVERHFVLVSFLQFTNEIPQVVGLRR